MHQKRSMSDKQMQVQDKEPEATDLTNQTCPFCNKKTLTLSEAEREIPYFGLVYLFSMTCTSCKYHKADVELAESSDSVTTTLKVETEQDMNVRVIKSSEATVTIPRIGSIEPGPASSGYITNIEGILRRIKHQIEAIRDTSEDDPEMKKRAKNMLKKIDRIVWGQEAITLTIKDPTGNSAILSDKAVIKRL